MKRENCIACIFCPTFYFDINVINVCKCTHDLAETPKIQTPISMTRSLIASTLIAGVLWKFIDIIIGERDADVMIYDDILMKFIIGSSGLMGIFISSYRMKLSHKYQRFLKNLQERSAEKLFGEGDTQKLRRWAFSYICLIMFVLLLRFVLMCQSELCKRTDLCPLIVLFESLLFASEMVFFGHMILEIDFFGVLLTKFSEGLVHTLCVETVCPKKKQNVEARLKQHQMFYHEVTASFRFMNDFYSPIFFAWYTITIALATTHFFLLVIKMLEGASVSVEIVDVLFKLAMCTAQAIYFNIKYQEITDSGEEIKSFLFRYPMSKLRPSEAAQVGMMISALHVQRPVINASDVFTIGNRLLSSISGTVVTYVLVALQFYVSWGKQ